MVYCFMAIVIKGTGSALPESVITNDDIAKIVETSDEWINFAKEADIPMVRMQHFNEVSEDMQAIVNGYIQEVVYPSGVRYKIASSPIEMDSVGELKTEPT